MSGATPKLEQSLRDLLEAFVLLEEEVEEKFGDDELSYAAALIETLEPAIESAVEDVDVSTSSMAALIDALSEALESLDPTAFENEDEENLDFKINEDDIDLDEDLDEDEEDIDIDEEA